MVEILEGNHGTKENGFTDYLSSFTTILSPYSALQRNALNLTTPSEERQELYGPDNIFQFSKCRTVGRHAGDHHGSPFSSRVFREDISRNIYRHITMTVNSIFTQSLQVINSLYSAKLKFLNFWSS